MHKRIISIILAVVVIVSFALPQPVYAVSETLTVSGDGDESGTWTYTGGAANWSNLNSSDADTTIASSASAMNYLCHNYSNMVGAPAVISQVVFYVRVRATMGTTLSLWQYVRIAGTNYLDVAADTTADATYATYSYTLNTNPATGLAWTKAQVDAAQFGIVCAADALHPFYWTYAYVTVTYTAMTAPALTTVAASSVSVNVATLNGNISDNGSSPIDHRGFVFDTAARAAPGNVAPVASGYVSWWTDNSTAFSLGAFSHIAGGLTANTDYYFRAFAHNAVGWTYGTELTFHTVGTPAGETLAASNIATTVARINSRVTNANGQLCDVRFGYDIVTRATVATYANVTAWVNDTYNTGDLPYVDIGALTAATPYFFRVEIRNDAGAVEGLEMTFTTDNGIAMPTVFQAIPASTTIAVSWVKGTGSNRTLVRYSTGSYPATTADGTMAYLNTGSSIQINGTIPGTTYYFSAWGETAGLYSAGHATTLATTLAYPAVTGAKVETPPSNSSFTQTPDESGVQTMPLLPGLISANATAFAVPENMLWYFIWSIISIGIGIILYNKGHFNIALAILMTAVMFGAGASMGLTMLWIVAGFLIVACGFVFFGDRR